MRPERRWGGSQFWTRIHRRPAAVDLRHLADELELVTAQPLSKGSPAAAAP
ncbi:MULTISPECIES: hypothetical protein [unclassified Streptomyces]|uniref:hypothetical protein n=1 Tax=Streptomyces sp. NPDC023588 TaxID=3154907 RepID=UPI0033FA8B9F